MEDSTPPEIRLRRRKTPIGALGEDHSDTEAIVRKLTGGNEEKEEFASEEEHPIVDTLGLDSSSRKPSRVTLSENLTVIVDQDDETPSSPPADLLTECKQLGFFAYFWDELTRGYSLDNNQSRYTEKRRKIYAFFRIPLELERFMFYGFLQCVDAFCYLFTFLPIRFIMSIVGSIFQIRPWTSAATCDFIKVLLIAVCSFLMQYIDTSILYHQVRGQGVIKLYIVYNMLEVADKLFSSFGQDVLDSLLWTANERLSARQAVRTLLHLLFAVGYATMHTFLVLLQATTLNVAFNSHNLAILSIMMSNNFVELKGSVFKKFAKANLFQMACSDVRERFHIMALLFVVIVRNMMAVNWSIEHLWEMAPDLLMVTLAEFLVDWLKHAFITKFNEINAEVYNDFTITIAFDVTKSRDDTSAFSDYSDQVSRRMGFIPIPLSIMLIRVLGQTFSIRSPASVAICVLAWLVLVCVKVGNGIVLLGQACQHVNHYRELQRRSEFDLYRRKIIDKKSKSAPSSPRISLVDFSDVCHQTAGVKGFTVSDLMYQWEELVQAQTRERRGDERVPAGAGGPAMPMSPVAGPSWAAVASLVPGERVKESAPPTPAVKEEERPPRRTQSMAELPRPRRDKSLPPETSIPEGEEGVGKEWGESKEEVKEEPAQISPKKRPTMECESLHDIQAYQMLTDEQGVERIE